MLKQLYNQYLDRHFEKKLIAKVKADLSQCDVKPLSQGQKKDIQSYYQKTLGHKVPVYWHEYFSSRNDAFSVKYIPSSVHHVEIVYRLNYYDFRLAYVDKALYDTFFPDVNRPTTVIKNINGYFYDGNKSITKAEALARCSSLPEAIIKPTLGGMRGQGVGFFSTDNGITDKGLPVEKVLSNYKVNYIVQEKVHQHEDMARLNPTSLNTLRVLTYRDGDQIFALYAIARIGKSGQYIDNLSAGGVFADVNLETGRVIKCGYGTYKENHLLTTSVGTPLDNYLIPSFDKVISLAKELHTRLPYFNLIGWDFGIDEDGEPVFIEWNRNPDIYSQTAHGPAFGEMTDEILHRVRTLPDTKIVKYL